VRAVVPKKPGNVGGGKGPSATTPPMVAGGYVAMLPDGEVWNQGTLYDPATAQWTLDGGGPPCKACAVIMLANGTVLAAGGVKTVQGDPYPTTDR